MAIMKQIQKSLDYTFENHYPLPSAKWKGFWIVKPELSVNMLYLYHYHHLVLVYSLITNQYLYEWWEKPADKRGLDSAKEYLEERYKKLNGDRE